MIIRAEYYAGPELRFLSNLDMLSMFHRTLRRSRLPFALSQGFNPHIIMTLGVALPVGLWSEREYFDVEMTGDMTAAEFIDRLNQHCPPGLTIKQAKIVEARTVSLMALINACSYRFIYKGMQESADEIVYRIMNSQQWMIESRGKKKNQQKDLRRGIYQIELQNSGIESQLDILAAANEPMNVRYDELIELLDQAGASRSNLVDALKTGNYHYSEEGLQTPLEILADQ